MSELPSPSGNQINQEILDELIKHCGGNPEVLAKDLQMIRVIEDLITLLLSKGVIMSNELPSAVQMKMLQRQSMREEGQFTFKSSGLIEF